MRKVKFTSVALVIVALGVGFGTVSLAFHDGGVGECSGCHNMHGATTTTRLLAGSDPSSTCLNCHQEEGLLEPSSYHVSTSEADMGPGVAPYQRTPGGDFGWLKKTYTWTVPWGTFGESGQTHGHNIVAGDFNYVADGRVENQQAPGGLFPASELSCTSCHDPHGKYRRLGGDNAGEWSIVTAGAPIIGSGSYQTSDEPSATEAVGVYRLLGGNGYGEFSVNPPVAAAPTTVFFPPSAVDGGYNQSEASIQVRVAYGDGMSQWCASCHLDMDNGLAAGHHPVEQDFSGGITDNYVQYRGSGDIGPTNTNADAFLSLVPYAETNGDDYAVVKGLAAGNSQDYEGPGTTGGMVNCMSCHRAHASGFEYALRWNPESEIIVENGQWPGNDNGSSPQFARGRTEAEMQAAYYDRDASIFATYQRSLCNKCHAQD